MNYSEMKNKDEYVSIDDLEKTLSDSKYTYFGHGTGRSGNEKVEDSIFNEGLKLRDKSMLGSAIELDTPSDFNKKLCEKAGLPQATMNDLKMTLNNWPHMNSNKIILIRFPRQYINYYGDIRDADATRYGAFFLEKKQPNGEITYEVNPKFIIGCYDKTTGLVKMNKNFEKIESNETKKELQEGLQKCQEKTQNRLGKSVTEIQKMQDKYIKDNEIPKINDEKQSIIGKIINETDSSKLNDKNYIYSRILKYKDMLKESSKEEKKELNTMIHLFCNEYSKIIVETESDEEILQDVSKVLDDLSNNKEISDYILDGVSKNIGKKDSKKDNANNVAKLKEDFKRIKTDYDEMTNNGLGGTIDDDSLAMIDIRINALQNKLSSEGINNDEIESLNNSIIRLKNRVTKLENGIDVTNNIMKKM